VKANLRREVAAAALGGGAGTEPIRALVLKGLSNYRDVRFNLRLCGLAFAVRDLRSSKAGRDYVRIALRRGAKAHIHLAPQSWYQGGTFDQKVMPLVTVYPASGALRKYADAPSAAAELATRVGTDVEAALRVILGIERARRRLYELCEEATRWL
jgi:hypothetical protein